MTALTVASCRQQCAWLPTDRMLASADRVPVRLFRCQGCGSEWTRDQAWRPADRGGTVPGAVESELAAP